MHIAYVANFKIFINYLKCLGLLIYHRYMKEIKKASKNYPKWEFSKLDENMHVTSFFDVDFKTDIIRFRLSTYEIIKEALIWENLVKMCIYTNFWVLI